MARYEEFASEFEATAGKPMETGSLGDRIVIQKVAYLLYRKGASSSYSDFSWYLHGVFSWQLWHDVIRYWGVAPERLSAEHVVMLERVRREFVTAGLTGYFGSANDLELVTTVLYCAKSQADLREDNYELVNRVVSLKGKFAEDQVRRAIGTVSKIGWKFGTPY